MDPRVLGNARQVPRNIPLGIILQDSGQEGAGGDPPRFPNPSASLAQLLPCIPAFPYPSTSLPQHFLVSQLPHPGVIPPQVSSARGSRGQWEARLEREQPSGRGRDGSDTELVVAPTGTPGSLRRRGDSRSLQFSSTRATTNSQGEEGAKLELRRSADGALRAPGRTESPGIAGGGGGISPLRAQFPFGRHLGIGSKWVLKERRREGGEGGVGRIRDWERDGSEVRGARGITGKRDQKEKGLGRREEVPLKPMDSGENWDGFGAPIPNSQLSPLPVAIPSHSR